MRRYICLLLVILLVVILAACTEKPLDSKKNGQIKNEMPYTIHKENGKCSLVFKDGYITPNDSANKEECKAIRYIYFDTVQEMINDIKTGNFCDEEKEIMMEFRENEDGVVQICDISSLHTALYPSTFIYQSIGWYGTVYFYTLSSGENGPKAVLNFVPHETYETDIDFYRNFDELTKAEMISVSSDPDRNAVVYDYLNILGEESKMLVYTIGEGTEPLHIAECYRLEESDTVPAYIKLYGQSKGKYFCVFLNQLQERPSVEWLSQFGICEYVETEAA